MYASYGGYEYSIEDKDTDFFIKKVGPAPLDYLIIAQTIFIEPPKTQKVYIFGWCDPTTLLYCVSYYPVIANGEIVTPEEDIKPLEEYGNIEDAGKSLYFKTLFHIDKTLDKLIEQIKQKELDTKFAPNSIRINANYTGSGFNLYGESYNKYQPELNEYVQVYSKGGKYTYSASHASYARQQELGEIYRQYFGVPPKQEYLLKINSLKDLSPKYSYFALVFKELQHEMMAQALEIGISLPETKNLTLSYDPIITSVRGAPGKTATGQLVEATIDINQYQRVYVIAVNTDGSENYFISSRSLYMESMPNYYRPFVFDWENVILKSFSSREEAKNDSIYGSLYTILFKLMSVIKITNKPYVWRAGSNDLYGFSNIVLKDGIGSEKKRLYVDKGMPSNLQVMLQPHP